MRASSRVCRMKMCVKYSGLPFSTKGEKNSEVCTENVVVLVDGEEYWNLDLEMKS